jgi:hypothetical protein
MPLHDWRKRIRRHNNDKQTMKNDYKHNVTLPPLLPLQRRRRRSRRRRRRRRRHRLLLTMRMHVSLIVVVCNVNKKSMIVVSDVTRSVSDSVWHSFSDRVRVAIKVKRRSGWMTMQCRHRQ